MSTSAQHLWLEVSPVGGATVVRFTLRELVKEGTVEAIGDKLFELVHERGQRNLVLDFGQVDSVVSTMVGKLTGLRKKLEEAGGRLALCGVKPHLLETFATLNLTGVLPIHGDEQEAVQSVMAPGEGR